MATGEPVFVPLATFKQHCQVRGMTGSLKSVFTTYVLSQIVSNTDACVLFADFGGDLFTFNTLKQIAQSRGKKFRFLSTAFTDDWDSFDPMKSCTPLSEATLIRATNYLVTSLSLSFGEGFSTGYFSDIAVLTIQDALSHCIDMGLLYPDINQVSEVAEKSSKHYRRNDVAQATMAFRQLANYPQLRNAPGSEDRAICFERAIENGEVIIGHLPGLLQPTSVKIGALMFWSLILAAIDRAEAGLPKKDVFLVVEECSVIARAPSFEKALTLGRKFGVRLVLVHQTSEQLRGGGHSADMRPIVSDNTAIKLLLTSTTRDDEDQLRGFSEDIERLRDGGKSYSGLNASTQIRGVYEPRLERNEILHTSAITGEGFLVYRAGDKHREPIRIKFDPIYFHEFFTPEAHAALSSIPLPKREAPPEPVPRQSDLNGKGDISPERRARHAQIRAVIEECKKEERWAD